MTYEDAILSLTPEQAEYAISLDTELLDALLKRETGYDPYDNPRGEFDAVDPSA